MSERIEKIIAEVLGTLDDCLPPKPVVVPEAPAPKAVVREVQVAPGDPNWSAANRGRVHVGIYEQAYWNAVQRAFNPPLFAEVISGYDPFARGRMPGYDPEDR
jgi:hypothetical protein